MARALLCASALALTCACASVSGHVSLLSFKARPALQVALAPRIPGVLAVRAVEAATGTLSADLTAWDNLIRQQALRQGLLQQAENQSKPMLIAYLSGVNYRERRDQVRLSCFPAIRAKGFEVKFFIGRPSFVTPDSHKSLGALATTAEVSWAKQLEQEIQETGDIQLLPFRDLYRDLSDKITGLMTFALQKNYQSILKIDDDMCPGLDTAAKVVGDLKPTDALYAGKYFFKGTEYKRMAGADGSVAPYASGVCYILSAALVEAIFKRDFDHTLLFASYGTDSDDANLGKWYEYSKQRNADLDFKMQTLPDLCTATPEVHTPAH